MPPLSAQSLTIEGPDAIAFAHLQLSSDVRKLEVGTWQWSAWLNPQGRVRALLHLMRPDEQRLCLLLRGGTAAALATALQPYVMRSRVTITAHAPGRLTGVAPCPVFSVHDEDDDTILGLGDYALRITTASSTTGDSTQGWRLAAIRAGHPWLPDATLDKLLAPSLSLRELGAASLDKGCFPGQEVLARLHYRGGCKQHLRHIQSDADLTPGGPLLLDEQDAGIVLDSVTTGNDVTEALTVMRDSVPQGNIILKHDMALKKTNTVNML